jgi:DNA-directed RNA polymerase specialized sigma24 family protein
VRKADILDVFPEVASALRGFVEMTRSAVAGNRAQAVIDAGRAAVAKMDSLHAAEAARVAARDAAREAAWAPARRAKAERAEKAQEYFLAAERRRAEMLARHEAGETYAEIGRAFGIAGVTVAIHCRKAMRERAGWRSPRLRRYLDPNQGTR